MSEISQIAAKLRNIFSAGKFQTRRADGKIQVLTHNGRVVEKKEAFPYGFCAKAKSGRALVFCQGGNMDGFEIFPVLIADDVTLPALEDGDTALFTEEGACIVLRNAGGIEITARGNGRVSIIGEGGKLYLGNGEKNMCAVLTGLIDEIINITTSGPPPSHTITLATQQKLEQYKIQIKKLFEESA